MDFQFSSEQQQLNDSVTRLLDKHYDFEERKALATSSTGHSTAVWAQLGELGLHALPLPEAAGGFDGGAVDLQGVMDGFGKALVLEPYVATQLVAYILCNTLSTPNIKSALEGVATGERVLALAHTEAQSRYHADAIECVVEAQGAGFVLSGDKVVVLHAPQANGFVVTAKHAGKLALAWVDCPDGLPEGMRLKSYRTVDNLRAADVNFRQVKCQLLSVTEQGSVLKTEHDLLEEALDFATVLHAAEAVGAMQFACDTTLEYLKTRKQFGAPIGSFQALQHRMVDMTISTEQARSLMTLASAKFDAFKRGELSARERMQVVSAAKIKVADACRHVGQEAIQLHGGMGMTQEMKVSHTFKRLTMLAQALGDADFHLERFARLASSD
jgi:alkylation response protein AidB-like acyl-CoA dehydrogenase